MGAIELKVAAVLIAALIMLVGVVGLLHNLTKNGHGFGPNSLRALGIVVFIPSLIIIGVSFPDFKSETISALLGTVGGYILSQASRDKDA